ncbi:MAG TPA: MauE/DoxX family redox-associated membrane protein [Cyclobacteriaceae bacterium]|nr:MauE/DoxX family redox-associated membrane protein [Cyclobacteriaceae bacterium]
MSTRRAVAIDIICALFILLFLYASVTKLLDYQEFRVQLGKSPIITSFAPLVAWFIPVLEILVSIMLIFQRTRLAGLYLSFGLMTMFTFYIIAITQFSDYIPCSCGGVLQNMGWTEHLVFNIAFSAFAAAGVLLINKDTDAPPLVVEASL